jgi:hypothetical protein
MSFVDLNAQYEGWLRTVCRVDEEDLARKHERMRKSAFVFLRATFFRWAHSVATAAPEIMSAPTLLCLGDAHLENFGTWRDAEERLVWGVNDFDDVAVIPYASDLVRLAVSVRLAAILSVGNREASEAILEGYGSGLREPNPTLLDEMEIWMRDYVACVLPSAERVAGASVDRASSSSLPGAAAGSSVKPRRLWLPDGTGLTSSSAIATASWKRHRQELVHRIPSSMSMAISSFAASPPIRARSNAPPTSTAN